MPNLRVVLDTNVILRAISSKSDLAELLDKLYDEEYEVVVSTEILFEYEEKISHFYGQSTSNTFLEFFDNSVKYNQNRTFFSVEPYHYRY